MATCSLFSTVSVTAVGSAPARDCSVRSATSQDGSRYSATVRLAQIRKWQSGHVIGDLDAVAAGAVATAALAPRCATQVIHGRSCRSNAT
jgi:hypothetical protein